MYSWVMRIWFLVSLGLVLAVPALAREERIRLVLDSATVQEAAAGGSVAIQGMLVNEAMVSQTLVRAASPVADSLILQRVGRDKKGLAVTEILPRLELAPRTALKLVEGLTELRLVGLKQDLDVGTEIVLVFERGDGQSQVVRVAVVGNAGDDRINREGM